MMNPWDIRDPWDMIDFDADEPRQFQFESPPLPEPVWNGDENNVGDPQPQPCAMDVSGNQPPQPVIDECFPEAMKRTEHYYGSHQPLQSQPQSCAIDVCGNQPPQLPSQPHPWSWPLQSEPQPCAIDVCGQRRMTFSLTRGYPPPQPQPHPQTEWDTRNMLELIPNVGGHQPLQPQLGSGLGRRTKLLSQLLPVVFRMLYTTTGRQWLLVSPAGPRHSCKNAFRS
ncbi:hypothetical protein HN51_060031 [Arachis hypogaea]